MLKIAITGKIATGKTTISKILKDQNFDVFESDLEVNKLFQISSLKKKIVEKFESKIKGILLEDGSINKEKLASHVFKDPDDLKILENVLYPELKKKKDIFITQNTNKKFVFFDIPLLFQKKLHYKYDYIILTYVSYKTKLKRASLRKNLSKKKLDQILKIQSYDEKKYEKFVSLKINTSTSIVETKKKLMEFIKNLL